MATHDYVISNASGAAVRADLNNALAAIVSNNSNATAPATTYAYQQWIDTSTTPAAIKQRNATNTDPWVTLGYIDGSIDLGSVGTPSIRFNGDTNTGIYSPGADQVAITTGGTARLYVGSTGSVGVGTTSPDTIFSVATARSDTAGSGWFTYTHSATSGKRGLRVDTSNGFCFDYYNGSTWSQQAAIDASGRLLVGTFSSSAAAKLIVQGNTSDGAAGGLAQLQIGSTTPASGAVLGRLDFSDSAGYQGAWIRGERDGGTWTSGSSHPGRLVFSTTADGASSPTERMRITNTGNFWFANTTGLANSTGVIFDSSGALYATRSNNVNMYVNRLVGDGTLIELQQDNTTEGSISVSGTTVSYNGAHLSRWSQIPGIDPHDKTHRPEILRGTVMSNLDEMCEWIEQPKEAVLWEEGEDLPENVQVGDVKEPAMPGGAQENEQLNKTKISDVEGDKNVAGVFQGWDDDDDTWVNDYYLAMTGDFVIRIAADVTVERGDLLMSAGDGTAKPQADDAVRSCTIAKVTSTTVSCTYEDGSYCVPCVLMAC